MDTLYVDALYGTIVVPPLVCDLMHTSLMQRLHEITLGTLPRSISPFRHATRFEHSIGVAHLARCALEQNNVSQRAANITIAAALLHDAASPPFSHTSEPLLHELTQCTGESFLSHRLPGTDTEAVLAAYGINSCDVVHCVTGTRAPFPGLVHGTMDVDNLDNVARFLVNAPASIRSYESRHIARHFKLCEGQPTALHYGAVSGVQMWRTTRRYVYNGLIYSEPHLRQAGLLRRALWFAMEAGAIDVPFFSLTDEAALRYLEDGCGSQVASIIERIHDVPSATHVFRGVGALPDASWRTQHACARKIADAVGIPDEAVSIVAYRSNAERTVTIPIVDDDGSLVAAPDLGRQLPTQQHVEVWIDNQHIDGIVRQRTTEMLRTAYGLVNELSASAF